MNEKLRAKIVTESYKMKNKTNFEKNSNERCQIASPVYYLLESSSSSHFSKRSFIRRGMLCAHMTYKAIVYSPQNERRSVPSRRYCLDNLMPYSVFNYWGRLLICFPEADVALLVWKRTIIAANLRKLHLSPDGRGALAHIRKVSSFPRPASLQVLVG